MGADQEGDREGSFNVSAMPWDFGLSDHFLENENILPGAELT